MMSVEIKHRAVIEWTESLETSAFDDQETVDIFNDLKNGDRQTACENATAKMKQDLEMMFFPGLSIDVDYNFRLFEDGEEV